MKVGIFDHLSNRIGGSQLVVAWMAKVLAQEHDVEVIHSGRGYSVARLGDAFGLDLRRVGERSFADEPQSFSIVGYRSLLDYVRRGWAADRRLTHPYDLFIYSGHGVPPFSFARQALIYCHFPFQAPIHFCDELHKELRRRIMPERSLRLLIFEYLWTCRMRRYATVFANSQFTAGWIARTWGRQAEVVYPPVAIQAPELQKQNVIVSLGRFLDTDRKNHARQLEAFRQFLALVRGDWSLCLIGFCADFPKDRAYVERLRQMTEGLPVTFIINGERNTVLRHLAEAKVFWHSVGLNPQMETEPRYMEHFGIATVEAMAAGCVPVVPAYGGQPEIVEDGCSGFLCRDMEGFVQRTVLLANAEDLRMRMSQRARDRSRAFHPDIFTQQFRRRISQWCEDRIPRENPLARSSVSPTPVSHYGKDRQ